MQEAWTEQMPKPREGIKSKRPVSMRQMGEHRTDEERAAATGAGERAWRPWTNLMGANLFGFYFGFLHRSQKEVAVVPTGKGREATPAGEGDATAEVKFRPEPGLGMPIDLIHPALLAVVDLTAGYFNWRKNRSAGSFAPTILQTLEYVAEFLKPDTGVVWKHDGIKHLERVQEWLETKDGAPVRKRLLFDIEAFRENWRAAVEEAYVLLRRDIADIKMGDMSEKVRKPFVPIHGYLKEADPMVPYMVGVRQMIASRPMGMFDQHLHRRNCILTLILVQTALRATTLLLTVSGTDPTLRREVAADGTVKWRIVIPAERFKNFSSPYFSKGQPYTFVLDDEDGLYAMLDEYLAKSRPYLLNGRQSDALFITYKGGDYTAQELSNTYRFMTGMFFVWNDETKTGIKEVMPHGLHAVRHVVATSLVRTTGDLYLAAWAIQDTARTVEENYAEFLPEDKVRLAVEHLRKSRAAA